jgi:hypothetical protein
MTQIFLNDDQINAFRQATDAVELRDPAGAFLGYITRRLLATPREIAEARERLNSQGPWHTTAEMLNRVQAR